MEHQNMTNLDGTNDCHPLPLPEVPESEVPETPPPPPPTSPTDIDMPPPPPSTSGADQKSPRRRISPGDENGNEGSETEGGRMSGRGDLGEREASEASDNENKGGRGLEEGTGTNGEEKTDDDDSAVGDIEINDDVDDRRDWNRQLRSHSHRSVRCPSGGCRRTLAAAGLLAHFRYEHRSVARARLSPHHALQFALAPGCLDRRPLALCIAELNLSGDYEELAVFSPDDEEGVEGGKRRVEAAGAICALLGRVVALGGGAGVAIAVWCACLFDPNDRPPVAYTLRASVTSVTSDDDRTRCRHVFRGPADPLCLAAAGGGSAGGGLLLPPPPNDSTLSLRLRFHRLVPRIR